MCSYVRNIFAFFFLHVHFIMAFRTSTPIKGHSVVVTASSSLRRNYLEVVAPQRRHTVVRNSPRVTDHGDHPPASHEDGSPRPKTSFPDIVNEEEFIGLIARSFYEDGDATVDEPVDRLSLLNFSLPNMTLLTAAGPGFIFDNSSMTSEEQPSLFSLIPMTIIYVTIFVSGIFGNVCTCIVIARNKYLQTATNYYLFSLAVSDLLLLILGLPQEIYEIWYPSPYAFSESYCIFRGLAAETSSNASILTITAFTIERYLAICYPLKVHTMSRLSRAVKLILIIWMIAASCAVPTAIQFGIVEQYDRCLVKEPLKHAFELSTILFFCLPMTLISVLYLLIAFRLRKSSSMRSIGESDSGESKTCSSRSPRIWRQQNDGGGSSGGGGGGGSTGQGSAGASSRRSVIKMLGEFVSYFTKPLGFQYLFFYWPVEITL